MILSIFSNNAGSFSFTHASLEAVKFPGEFNKCERDSFSPIASKCFFANLHTARLSHQIMLLRKTLLIFIYTNQSMHLVSNANCDNILWIVFTRLHALLVWLFACNPTNHLG